MDAVFRSFKRLFQLLVYSNLYVAVPVVALYVSATQVFGVEIDRFWTLGLYGLTLFTYNFHRWMGLRFVSSAHQSARMKWSGRNPSWLIGSMIAGLSTSGYCYYHLFNWNWWYWLLPVGLITAAYSLPIIPLGKAGWKRLREVPAIKFVWIAAVVTVITSWAPFSWVEVNSLHWLWWLHQFLWLCGLTIPFDIRDMEVDQINGTPTLPLLVGEQSAKGVALLLLVIAAGVGLAMGHYHLLWVDALAMITVIRSNANRSEIWYAGWVEGLLILQGLFSFW